MSWLRQHWRFALVLLAVGVCGILLLVLYILHKNKEADALRADLALMMARSKVDGLVADRQARQAELDRDQAKKRVLDAEIAEARRKALEIHQDTSKMSDLDVALEFKKLGY